jgi:hypothetical protein
LFHESIITTTESNSRSNHSPESAPSPSQELIPESISKLFRNGFARENKVGARTKEPHCFSKDFPEVDSIKAEPNQATMNPPKFKIPELLALKVTDLNSETERLCTHQTFVHRICEPNRSELKFRTFLFNVQVGAGDWNCEQIQNEEEDDGDEGFVCNSRLKAPSMLIRKVHTESEPPFTGSSFTF